MDWTGQSFRTYATLWRDFHLIEVLQGSKAHSAAKPVIPKRGEKDFEPTEGSGLQSHQLQRARTAMFDVLRATRSTTMYASTYNFRMSDPNLVVASR